MTTGFDRAQAAWDSAEQSDPEIQQCTCGHEIEDHIDCPCVHGCDATPCDVGGCDCPDYDEQQPYDEWDAADVAYDEAKGDIYDA